jgi:hypothetical protein
MRKYAIVINNVVSSVIQIEPEDFGQYAGTFIDIEDLSPQPAVGWVLNGNKLEYPIGQSSVEELEIRLAEKKTDFGIKLSYNCINKIGARNKILNKNGTQVTTLLNQLIGVKMLLETGALGTARYSCSQLKLVYTEYADIFDYVISEVNTFESSYGL